MSIEWVAGSIALISMVATVYFIVAHIDIPDAWWALVMTSIITKLFGGKKNGNGN